MPKLLGTDVPGGSSHIGHIGEFCPCFPLGLHDLGFKRPAFMQSPRAVPPLQITSPAILTRFIVNLKWPRIAVDAPSVTVGRIADLTGKYDLQTGSQIGQGSTLFALTALGRAGFLGG